MPPKEYLIHADISMFVCGEDRDEAERKAMQQLSTVAQNVEVQKGENNDEESRSA